MTASTTNPQPLQTVASVLLWCTLIGFGILIFWFGLILLGLNEFAYSIHTHFSTISRQQFDVLMYLGLMFWKMTVMLFFLIPYISIQIVLRSNKV